MMRVANIQTTRVWSSYGYMGSGLGNAGLSHLYGYDRLGSADWYIATFAMYRESNVIYLRAYNVYGFLWSIDIAGLNFINCGNAFLDTLNGYGTATVCYV